MFAGLSRRHAIVLVCRGDPPDQFTLGQIARHNRKLTRFRRLKSVFLFVEAQLRFPFAVIRPMAGVTVFGKDRPDIAIEVLSPQARDIRRDRVEKLAEYAAFGIRYYWLVEFKTRTFEIHELGPDSKYVLRVQQQSGTIAPVLGCADLSLDLDAFWNKAAELEAE